jgi:hypothetical protein
MLKISSTQKAYLAGFIDGDGSIYVRLKPNDSYRYGFQVAPYIILFQSSKHEKVFKEICSLIDFGYLRKRKDGILEYTIGRVADIEIFLTEINPYLILKRRQSLLMLKILNKKKNIKDENDFRELIKLIDSFRNINYSKKRKKHKLTP